MNKIILQCVETFLEEKNCKYKIFIEDDTDFFNIMFMGLFNYMHLFNYMS
jgi:hypothetical protein